MDLFDITAWIPTGVLALAWLIKSLISTRLKSSVQHEFNEKLESFNSQLRSKENEIAILRDKVITGLSSRHIAVDKRRIEAAEQIWNAVLKLAPAKTISAQMSAFNYEAASKAAVDDQKVRDFFIKMGEKIDKQETYTPDADKERPFISDLTWALFSAYRTIVASAVIAFESLQSGLDMSDILNREELNDLIIAVLPHRAEQIRKMNVVKKYYLLEELEKQLLKELRKMQQGIEYDKETIDQSTEIFKYLNQVKKSIEDSKKEEGDS